MRFDVATFSNAGGRPYNEDAVGYLTEEDSGIFVVADGLGGHEHGEVASSCARDVMLEGWHPAEYTEARPVMQYKDAAQAQGAFRESDRAAWLAERAFEANRSILALQEESGSVLKSTLAALAIDGDQAVWAHVGDTRIYYLHRGWVQEVTEDHSVAYKKFKAGEISREALAWDEDQSRLLRSLGSVERYEAQVTVCDTPIEPGDAFLLCSDGAWEYLRDGEIAIDLLKAENAEQWIELLLLRMMDRITSGNDNLTLLTVMID
ncbi:MAG: serine/threonine-protein phosphatase [Lachnospiraceae bacterium]|nr:serine/threonine-protein phosphatase [Lachnospiraceae bacterium]